MRKDFTPGSCAIAITLAILLGCKTETVVKHDVSGLACPDPETQYRDLDGYCVCDPEFGKFNPETDECEDCEPVCDGKACGPDGCGGSCGSCNPGTLCVSDACEPCEPICDGVQCGSDGCGGSCGDCSGSDACVGGTCVSCQSDCADKTCGPDGCGGVCGNCDDGNETCIQGNCMSEEQGLPCGTVVTSCNCQSPPQGAYPGATRAEAVCDSKLVVFSLCPGACTDGWGNFLGYPWQETCDC